MVSRALIGGLAAVVALAFLSFGAFWAYLALAFAEPQDMDPSGLRARIFLPDPIRRLDLPGRCAAMTVSLSYQECTAGICGERYRLSGRTRVSEGEFAAHAEAARLRLGLAPEDLSWELLEDIDPAGCRTAHLRLYFPYR